MRNVSTCVLSQFAQHKQLLQFRHFTGILRAGLKAIGHFQVKKNNKKETSNIILGTAQTVEVKTPNKTLLQVECRHRQDHDEKILTA